jgi:uncharacterized membrane protein
MQFEDIDIRNSNGHADAMNPMTHLIAATTAFLATHYVSSTPLRAKLVAALGNAYLGLYSLIAFATLGYMIWAYYRAPFVALWHSPALRYVPLIVMPIAFILMACGLLTRNPTLVGQERLLNAVLFLHSTLFGARPY